MRNSRRTAFLAMAVAVAFFLFLRATPAGLQRLNAVLAALIS